MRKIFLLGIVILFSNFLYAQNNEESTTRKFIKDARFKQINKDWTTMATFKSGIGETVEFYPIEVINLKTKEKIKALQLDMKLKKPKRYVSVWVGLDEIDEFTKFIRDYIVPHVETELKKASSESIFQAKEMTMIYLITEEKRKLSINLNDYGDVITEDEEEVFEEEIDVSDNKKKSRKRKRQRFDFWTETQVDKIPVLLEVLNKIK